MGYLRVCFPGWRWHPGPRRGNAMGNAGRGRRPPVLDIAQAGRRMPVCEDITTRAALRSGTPLRGRGHGANYSGALLGTTSMGEEMCCSNAWLTDPCINPDRPPKPRVPTTRRTASRAAWAISGAGFPDR